LTISRVIAFNEKEILDPVLLKDWLYNEDKITSTFLKYKNEGGNFRNILLTELKK
jgi:hypothetical protein